MVLTFYTISTLKLSKDSSEAYRGDTACLIPHQGASNYI